MSIECDDSSQCDDDGIVRFCYEEASFSNETFFCDCSNWYGWTGKNCNEESTQLTYFRFSTIFFSILFFGVVMLCSRTIVLLFMFMKNNKVTRKKLTPIFTTT